MDRTLTLPGWVRQLYQGILFSGPSSSNPGTPRLLAVVLLVVLPALLLYPSLDFRLFEPDESRYAQIPREMLERGDWLVPTLQGEPYLDKPPLFYWLVMASYSLLGCHDWAARLVPALAVHATILLTYLFGRRSLGEGPATLASLILALTPGIASVARLLLLDGLLTLFVTLAILAAFEAVRGPILRRGWWFIAALATGLGVLTKGPVAILLLVPPLVFHRLLSEQGTWPTRRDWLVFVAVILALALPWYVALSVRLPGFFRYFFWEHNVQRFLAPQMHVRGVWFYPPVVLLLLVPASFLLIPVGRFLLSNQHGHQRSLELGFHLLVGVWIIGFFTLSSCKLPTYILPALPFLALVIGQALLATGWHRALGVRVGACLAFALMLLTHHVAVPWYANYRSPMSRPREVLELCANPAMSVVCYPRNCDSIAFYLGRSDLRAYRSKEIEDLRTLVRVQPRTVILCTHRHSLQGLEQLLPPEVRITQKVRLGLTDIPGVPRGLMRPLARLMGETALGLSDIAVVEMPSLVEANQSARAGGS